MRALEFFSGIGAFAVAAREFGIEVVRAFDQNAAANVVYEHNFGLRPSHRNLDSIKVDDIPKEADLWWMSPPCTPFSVRGHRKDRSDPRAKSFLNLIDIACVVKPHTMLVENVLGFRTSQVELVLYEKLQETGYHLRAFDLCPTDFGVPMRRPRHYVIAVRNGGDAGAVNIHAPDMMRQPLSALLDSHFDDELLLPPDTVQRYSQGFDIVDPAAPDAELICFTKNYARCMKSSGSILQTPRGLRRVSPKEILRLLGFPEEFAFPKTVDLETQWRLVGNSVDVRAIRFILNQVAQSCHFDRSAAATKRRNPDVNRPWNISMP